MRGRPPSPGPGVALRAWIGFLLLLAAHFSVRPFIAGRWSVDFVILAILFSGMRMRPGLAAVVGFCTGLALDALAPETFGAHAIVLTVIAYASSWLEAAFFAEHVALTGLVVFGGKWLFDLAMTLLVGARTGVSTAAILLFWSPFSAVLTALVAVLLLVLLRPLYRPLTR